MSEGLSGANGGALEEAQDTVPGSTGRSGTGRSG